MRQFKITRHTVLLQIEVGQRLRLWKSVIREKLEKEPFFGDNAVNCSFYLLFYFVNFIKIEKFRLETKAIEDAA